MKKNIRLLESEFVNLIRKVLSEQETNEQVVKGTGNDPYEYKKEGNKYYTRKKGSSSWIETKGNDLDFPSAEEEMLELKFFSLVRYSGGY